MNILISGGTGFVGKKLGAKLSKNNHNIFVLSRKKESLPFPCTMLDWQSLQLEVTAGKIQFDAVINLAGESIDQRWSSDAKNKIYTSRISTTSKLVEIFKKSRLKTFISTSAVGYYGDRSDELLNEDSGSGYGFLTEVCKDWEKEAFKIQESTRVSVLRFGMVLGKEGGALPKMILPFKKGVGGMIADGEAWMSWIHIDDLTELISQALENNYKGIYNAVSPNPVKNKEFSKELAGVFNKKLFLPVPKIALKLLLGEMSQIILSSQRVFPKHTLAQGFKYQYPEIKGALESLCR